MKINIISINDEQAKYLYDNYCNLIFDSPEQIKEYVTNKLVVERKLSIVDVIIIQALVNRYERNKTT